LTLGAAHLLAREHGVTPGRRVLLAGSGPLLFPALHALLARGAKVVGVLEATRLTQWTAHAPALWGQWERLREGATYFKDMLRARVPYRPGHTVSRALGEERVEAAVVVRLDRDGQPVQGSEEPVEIDALCLGFGFVPNIELTQLARCFHQYDPTRGGWVPVVNQRLETSLPNLFAAGETVGVDGAAAALLEGHVAGLAAAQRVGAIPMDRLEREVAGSEAQRRRHRRFGTMLNTLFGPPPGLDALTTPDTPLCRCEGVTAGEVREALRAGVRELDELKIRTRVGQGPCQGRTCGPLLARFMARHTEASVESLGRFHVRPPIKPVPVGEFNPEVRP
jgi:NADPH-dependent 2,4-dienoyl-CoA reductase/sulfur reductase-like enzyme